MKKVKGIFFALLCAALIISAAGGCSLFGGNKDQENKEETSGSSSSAQSSPEDSVQENSQESSSSESSASAESKAESSQSEKSKAESSADESSAALQSWAESSSAEPEISHEESSVDDTGFIDFSGENKDLSLRELYESSEYNDVIEDTKKQYESDDYDIDVSLEGESTVIVTARSKKQIDPADIDKSTLDSYFDSIGDQAGSYIALLEGTTTTDNIEIKARIVNANGSIIAARTYSRQDAGESEADTEPVGRDLASIVGSPLMQKLFSQAAAQTGDSGAQVSTEVQGDNVIISITLSQTVPDGAEQAVAAQLGDLSSNAEDLREQLAALSSDENVTVTIRVSDQTGKQIV